MMLVRRIEQLKVGKSIDYAVDSGIERSASPDLFTNLGTVFKIGYKDAQTDKLKKGANGKAADPPAGEAKEPKPAPIHISADRYGRPPQTRPPHSQDEANGSQRSEAHCNLDQIGMQKEVTADHVSEGTRHV